MIDQELKCAHVRSEHFSEAATCALDPIAGSDIQAALTVRAKLCPLCAGRVHGALERLARYGVMASDAPCWLNADEITQCGRYLYMSQPMTTPMVIEIRDEQGARVIDLWGGLSVAPLLSKPRGRFFGPIPNDEPGA